jgi:3-oxoacyl-[acyl-carrier protein] reductase
VAELAVEDWDRVQAVNPRAPFGLSKAVLPHMRAAGNGTIVSVSSVAGKRGWANAGEQATRPQSEGPAVR